VERRERTEHVEQNIDRHGMFEQTNNAMHMRW